MLTHVVISLDYFKPNMEIKITFGQFNYLPQSAVDERRVIANMQANYYPNGAFDISL